jgi:Holliday junction resolvasome RuvABC endonuclease subunit
MLALPEQAGYTALIIGIDPGSNTLGFSEIYFDVRDLSIIKSVARTLKGASILGPLGLSQSHSDRYCRIFSLAKEILKNFVELEPNFVICESPFISSRQPMAYGALMEIVFAVRRAVLDYDSTQPMDTVDPPRAKKAVGAPGNAKKPEMQSAVIKLKDEFKLDELLSDAPLESLDEHSIDALAIAYFKLQSLRRGE